MEDHRSSTAQLRSLVQSPASVAEIRTFHGHCPGNLEMSTV